MQDSDNQSPWGDDESPTGSEFDAAPLPPMPTIPPPATATATLEPAPSPPTGSPVLSGVYGETQPPIPDAPAGGGGRLAWIGAIAGALVLLVGGGFFALTALQAAGGAATPEEAVDMLIEAVNDEDVITLGELLEPAERRTIVDPSIDEILPELIRLGVLADGFDAGGVDGIDLELTDVTYRIDTVAGHDDLVHVVFTGGQAMSSTQMDEFPFGEPILRRFGDSMRDESPTSESIQESDNPLVLVKRNERWYVSLWYSLGEAVRLELGESLPLASEMPVPRGSSSPEAAVEQFVLDAFDFDVAGMLSRIDPEEADALYRYAPLFIDGAQDAMQSARRDLEAEGVDWEMSDMRFSVDRDGDDAIVDLEGFTFTFTTPDWDLRIEYAPDRLFARLDGMIDGEDTSGTLEITPTRWRLEGSSGADSIDAEVQIDADTNTATLSGQSNGEPFSGSLTVDESGECSSFSFIGFDESEIGCLEERLGEAGAAELGRQQLLDLFAFSEREYPAAAFAVHETGGEWYVSPTLTVMNAVVAGLESVDQAEFDEFLDQLEELNGSEPITLDDVLGAPLEAADELGGFATDPFGLPLGDDDLPVIVEDFDPDRFDPVDPPPAAEFIVTPGVEPTRYRDELVEPGQRHVYEVGMRAGEELGVTLYGETVVGNGGLGDPLLTIEAPDGMFWDMNDDFDGLNSGLRFTADRAGSWRVIVEDLGGNAGVYELTLQLPPVGTAPSIGPDPFDTTTPTAPPPVEADMEDFEEISVVSGETLVFTDAIEAQLFDVYAFEAPAGATLTVSLEARPGSSLDPRLILRDADLEVIADNDDAPLDAGLDLLDSQVVVTVAQTDAYYIEVRSFADSSAGEYTLTIESS